MITEVMAQRVAEWCFGGTAPPAVVQIGLTGDAPAATLTMATLHELLPVGAQGYTRIDIPRGPQGWAMPIPPVAPNVRTAVTLQFQNTSSQPWPTALSIFVCTPPPDNELLWIERLLSPVTLAPLTSVVLPERVLAFADNDGTGPLGVDVTTDSRIVWRGIADHQEDPSDPGSPPETVPYEFCNRPIGAAFAAALLKLEHMIYSVVGSVHGTTHAVMPGETWKGPDNPDPRVLWPILPRQKEREGFPGDWIYEPWDYLSRGEWVNHEGVPLTPRSPDPLREKQEKAHPAQITNVVRDWGTHPFDPPAGVAVAIEADFDPTGRLDVPKLTYIIESPVPEEGEVNMQPVGGNRWRGEIPGAPHDTEVSWWLSAHYQDVGLVTDPTWVPVVVVYEYRVFTHVTDYGTGFPEQVTNHDTDHWDFAAGHPIKAQHINLARWALEWLGSMYEHDPRSRPDAECCVAMPIQFYWSGSAIPGQYLAGGRPEQVTSRNVAVGNPPAGPFQARASWRGFPKDKYLDGVIVSLPNRYYGGDESWRTLPQVLEAVTDPTDPNYGGIVPLMKKRGIQDCDVVDPEHVLEIIAAVNWLETNGMWIRRANGGTSAYTMTDVYGYPCGRNWFGGGYIDAPPGQRPYNDCYDHGFGGNDPFPEPTCGVPSPHPPRCSFEYHWECDASACPGSLSHAWCSAYNATELPYTGECFAGIFCNVSLPGEPPSNWIGTVSGWAAWVCGPPDHWGDTVPGHGNGYEDWDPIYHPAGIHGFFGNKFDALDYCGEHAAEPQFDASTLVIFYGEAPQWKEAGSECPGVDWMPPAAGGIDLEQACSRFTYENQDYTVDCATPAADCGVAWSRVKSDGLTPYILP